MLIVTKSDRFLCPCGRHDRWSTGNRLSIFVEWGRDRVAKALDEHKRKFQWMVQSFDGTVHRLFYSVEFASWILDQNFQAVLRAVVIWYRDVANRRICARKRNKCWSIQWVGLPAKCWKYLRMPLFDGVWRQCAVERTDVSVRLQAVLNRVIDRRSWLAEMNAIKLEYDSTECRWHVLRCS